MAVVTISVRTRMTMAVLRVRDGVIVLQTLLWPDEVRLADFSVLDGLPEPTDAELSMAHLLVESMAGDFDPSGYEDEYAAAVEALVQAKLAGGQVAAPASAPQEAGKVVDLLAALQQSVDRARAARGDGARGEGEAKVG
jgi:DNA end-binding protein Ku